MQKLHTWKIVVVLMIIVKILALPLCQGFLKITFYKPVHLILTTALWSGPIFNPHFPDKETEALES